MEQLQNGFTLELCPGAFPLSTDSVALAGFVKLPPKATVLDLCSGCGTLGLMLCARDENCSVTGVCNDVANIPEILPPGSFRCCISNPPYFNSGPASQTHPSARREDTCTLDTLLNSAAWALQYGGDFYMVHRPERLAEIITKAANLHLEPKRLCLLRHRESGPVTLVLIQCKKGGKPGLTWEEWALYDAQGIPTERYKTLYHL